MGLGGGAALRSCASARERLGFGIRNLHLPAREGARKVPKGRAPVSGRRENPNPGLRGDTGEPSPAAPLMGATALSHPIPSYPHSISSQSIPEVQQRAPGLRKGAGRRGAHQNPVRALWSIPHHLRPPVSACPPPGPSGKGRRRWAWSCWPRPATTQPCRGCSPRPTSTRRAWSPTWTPALPSTCTADPARRPRPSRDPWCPASSSTDCRAAASPPHPCPPCPASCPGPRSPGEPRPPGTPPPPPSAANPGLGGGGNRRGPAHPWGHEQATNINIYIYKGDSLPPPRPPTTTFLIREECKEQGWGLPELPPPRFAPLGPPQGQRGLCCVPPPDPHREHGQGVPGGGGFAFPLSPPTPAPGSPLLASPGPTAGNGPLGGAGVGGQRVLGRPHPQKSGEL